MLLHIGDRLRFHHQGDGLRRANHFGALTRHAGTTERYVREWLGNQQSDSLFANQIRSQEMSHEY